jgi:glutaredoxin
MGIEFREENIAELPNLLAWFRAKGFTTVPQIFDLGQGGLHVGGADQLGPYLKERLQDLHKAGFSVSRSDAFGD